tara:strand:+ start:3011 stop:4033 length:1023 start_codon:yes stop_codon:yes gene_type:complete
MSVRVNHNKFLADFMIEGKRIKRQFDTELDAQAFEIETKRQHQYGKPVVELTNDNKVYTIRAMLDKTFTKYWQGKANEEVSMVNMKLIEGFFKPHTPLESITTERIDDFIMYLQNKGNKPSTINSKLSTLSKCIKFSNDRGYLKIKPKIERPKVGNNARLRFLDEQEEEAIIELLEENGKQQFRDFFVWSIDTGMRPIEARNLHQKNIRKDDALGWVVDIKIVKNVKGTTLPRTLPLTDRAVEAFNRLNDQVYPFARFDKGTIRSHWDWIRSAMGNTEEEFVFYLTRHTCASRLVQRGVDITIVQKWMGHRQITTTMIYAKLIPANLLQAKDALTKLDNH